MYGWMVHDGSGFVEDDIELEESGTMTEEEYDTWWKRFRASDDWEAAEMTTDGLLRTLNPMENTAITSWPQLMLLRLPFTRAEFTHSFKVRMRVTLIYTHTSLTPEKLLSLQNSVTMAMILTTCSWRRSQKSHSTRKSDPTGPISPNSRTLMVIT